MRVRPSPISVSRSPRMWSRWPVNKAFLSIFATFIVLRGASSLTASLGYVLLALYALRGRFEALVALMICWFYNLANPDFFPESGLSVAGRYIVIFVCALSVFTRPIGRISIQQSHIFLWSLVFSVYIVFHSLAFSAQPTISLLKSIIWILAWFTASLGSASLSTEESNKLGDHLLFILSAVAILSFALFLTAGAHMPGYEDLLRGALAHSQELGVSMACVAVWSLIRALSYPEPPLGLLALFSLALLLIFLSGSRTSLLSGLGAFALVTGAATIRQDGCLPGLSSKRMLGIGLLCFLLALIQYETIWHQVETFMDKRSGQAELEDKYRASRGGLIEAMLSNIQADPIFGIGFGIASVPADMEINYVWDIPVGAPIEKGVTPIAVLEELGLLGFCLFCGWVLSLMK